MSESQVASGIDKELVDRARRGDARAFGELYERYVITIYRYVRSRVGEDAEAEDITEAVFLRSFEAIDRYREKGHPYSAYLYRVAKNMLADHYRGLKEVLPLEEVEAGDGEIGVDELVIQDEEREGILQALGSLPGDYQEVIRLRIIMNLSTPETAEWMGRSAGAVRVLLHRALNALRDRLAESDS
jgi:RNA polymerase sigma-70 factor (ECF subfamily)